VEVADPDTGARLAPGSTGEFVVRGPQVMQGYWRNEEATARVLRGGWLHTGDLGRLTARGDLVFVGRAKDTIVLAGGENVEPEPLEQVALACPSVAQIVVVGQDRKTLAALVWPREGRPRDAAVIRAEIDAAVRATGLFRPWERIATVVLLPRPLSVEEGTLTATLKVRRAVVASTFADLAATAWSDSAR
jgi:long-chain acyl-CoA synthetase